MVATVQSLGTGEQRAKGQGASNKGHTRARAEGRSACAVHVGCRKTHSSARSYAAHVSGGVALLRGHTVCVRMIWCDP